MVDVAERFNEAMSDLPLVAILRGLKPGEAADIGGALVAAGFRLIEVPLNSPDPLASIETLAARFGGTALIGAGTVLSAEAVREVAERGGSMIVSPHCDSAVIHMAHGLQMAALPGVMTPTEAFTALAARASALKLFPAEMIPPAGVKAMLAVLPPGTRLLPVGGITPANMADYRAAGAAGFGLGSALYRPGDTTATVSAKAEAFVRAWRNG